MRLHCTVHPRMTSRLIGVCAVLATVTACDLSVGPTPGMVETIGVVLENRIVVPDTVTRGTPFVVQFITGGYFCFRYGGQKVSQSAMSAIIEPRMFINLTDSLCELGNSYTHHVTLRFDQAGPGIVVIRSLSAWPGRPPVDTVEFARSVVVR